MRRRTLLQHTLHAQRLQARLVHAKAQRIDWNVPCTDGAHHIAAKALLEAVDAPQAVTRQRLNVHRQIPHGRAAAVAVTQSLGERADFIGYTPEIVACSATAARPAYSRPLQRMIGHAVALAVARCAPEVPRHFAHRANHYRRHRLPLKLGHQIDGMLGGKQRKGGVVVGR